MRQERRIVVVSNRMPPFPVASTEEERRNLPVGGLVTALLPALEEQGGLWMGWSGETTGDKASARLTVSRAGPIQLAAMDLTKSEVNLSYNVFCNRTLWPLLHSFPAKGTIRHDAYRAYRRVNRRFAEALLPLLEEEDLVWVHDYHLIPLGYELRQLGWSGKIGYFLHTPFPPAELLTILPWAGQLLETLLSYDLVGLQTTPNVHNLLDTLSAELEGKVSADVFTQGDQSLRVSTYPVGIDSEAFEAMAIQARVLGSGDFLRRLSRQGSTVLGVDRLDYTKGIGQRLLSFERLLERYPSLRRKVSMIQISAPSRGHVPEYVEERRQVDHLVGRINGRFSEAGWVPIHYLHRSYPRSELAAFYRSANVCLVVPLRDGMNLVAKEFVASQDEKNPGVLVLSKFCGAAETMKDALIVNPYDIEATAQAIYRAIRMSRSERRRRWEALIQDVRTFTAPAWCNAFLSDLARR